MIFKLHGQRRYNAKKIKEEGESLFLSFKSMYESG
jgi:DNA-dependent RNA polymerase auxiliary subunit epsilon